MIATHQLWATYKSADPQDAPELLLAWDEFCVDANGDGWADAKHVALANVGGDLNEYREIIVLISREAVINAFDVPVLDGGVVGAAKSPHLSLATALNSLLVPGLSDIVIKAGTPASIVAFGSMHRTELVVSEPELEAWDRAQDGEYLDLADGQRARLVFWRSGPLPLTLCVRILPEPANGEMALRVTDEAFGLGV